MRFTWLLAFILGLVLVLALRFPYAAQENDQRMRLLYLVLWLILIAGGWRMRRITLSQGVQYGAIWLGILVALVLGYSFRDRLLGELVPGRAQIGAHGVLTVHTAQDGHFHIEAQVNGAPVDFVIDTGASDIMLTPQDARRAGIATDTLNYNRTFRTAGGAIGGAAVKIGTLKVGVIELHDFPASVSNVESDESLLGMSFLQHLHGYGVSGDTLTLRP